MNKFIDMRSSIATALHDYLDLQNDKDKWFALTPEARSKVRLASKQLNNAYENLIKAKKLNAPRS